MFIFSLIVLILPLFVRDFMLLRGVAVLSSLDNLLLGGNKRVLINIEVLHYFFNEWFL